MNLCKSSDCTGCLACYNACPKEAIYLAKDEKGFTYPAINHATCIDCGLCNAVCPIIDFKEKTNKPIKAFAAWQKNKTNLFQSSSGGVFFSIASHTIRNSGYVYGAAYDEVWRVKHKGINNLRDLNQLQGSKYIQSDIGFAYREIYQHLSQKEKVLFVGTPCQVAGLKTFLNSKRTNVSNLISVDIACHGVPTPLMFKEYLSHLENQYKSKVVQFSFRDKKWSWYRFNCKAIFENGKTYLGKWEEDIFMRGFLRDLFLRESCGNCRFTNSHREGDITLSDYWNYQKKQSEKDNHDTGVSVVLVNTKNGAVIFDEIKNDLICYSREVSDAIKSSPPYSHPFAHSPLREQFWKDYQHYGFAFLIDKYFYPDKIDNYFQKKYKYGRTVSRLLQSIKQMKEFSKVFIWKAFIEKKS